MEPRKYKKFDLDHKRKLFFRMGLVASLTLIITAFEWKFQVYTAPVVLPDPVEMIDFVVVPTVQPEAAPPPVRKTQQTAVKKPELPDKPPVELSKVAGFKPDDATVVETISFTLPDEPVRSESVEPFLQVEKQPEPSGGWEDFYEYLAKNLRYPRRAKQMGLEGIVRVCFIVDTDGSITGVKALNSLGGGCDEEAVRVIQMAPKWNPGKQRGIPVRVRMQLPLVFRLD